MHDWLRGGVDETMTGLNKRKLHLAESLLLAASAVAVLAPLVHAQATVNVPAFEAASIRPNTSVDARTVRTQTLPGGRLIITNTPLLTIIATAYKVPFQSMRLTGGPAWIRSDRYDIEAIAGPGAVPPDLSAHDRSDRMMLMLRKLLADRFGLTMRSERNEIPAYAILVGKNGLKLQKSKIDEKDCPDAPPQGSPGCHNFFGGMGRGMTGDAVSIEDLAAWVENWADRPVVDQTGVKGLFQLKTDGWVPMRPTPPRPAGTPQPGVAEDLTDPMRPTLFTVFDQMGLKLEAQKLPVDTYAIEKVDRPSQN
jgi:uncharacterized protein (TIGR03435 family)